MRLMPTKAVAFRPAGGIRKPIALCGSPVGWGCWALGKLLGTAKSQIDGKIQPHLNHPSQDAAKECAETLSVPFLLSMS